MAGHSCPRVYLIKATFYLETNNTNIHHGQKTKKLQEKQTQEIFMGW